MNSVLKSYNVRFSTHLDFHIGFYNRMHSENEALTIISDWNSFADANHLLNEVNSVLKGNVAEGHFDTNSLSLLVLDKATAQIYLDSAAYYNDEAALPDITLPTEHLQIIVKAWRDYLCTSITRIL